MNKLTKIFIASLMLFSTTNLFAQEKISEYESFGKTYDIKIAKRDGDSYRLYIEMSGLGGHYDYGGIYFDERTHPLFVESLIKAVTKYAEWDSIAIANKVNTHRQPMDFNPECGAFFIHDSKLNFDFSVEMNFNFNVVNSTPYLVIKTPKLVSEKNPSVTSLGYLIIFNNPKELENFTNLISMDVVNKFLGSQKTSNLFKNE